MFGYGMLYGEDGEPVARVLGFDNDGFPILDHRDGEGRGAAGEDLGPADPIDELDGEDPPFSEEIPWHEFDPPDFEDLDEEANDGLELAPGCEPPAYEDLRAWDEMTRGDVAA